MQNYILKLGTRCVNCNFLISDIFVFSGPEKVLELRPEADVTQDVTVTKTVTRTETEYHTITQDIQPIIKRPMEPEIIVRERGTAM